MPERPQRPVVHAEVAARDHASLDLFRLMDESITNLDKLPEAADPAREIIENIRAGLNSFPAAAAAP